jgi:phosphatidylglycerophosphatase A
MLAAAATIAGQACAVRLHNDRDPDPQYVIIDEVAGVWLALAALPATNRSWLAGSIVFRVLDKFKPGPIGVMDRHGGTWSLMGDDLLAGLLAAILVRLGARLGASAG